MAGRQSGDVQVDISSPDSVRSTLEPTLDPTADIPDNVDAVAARYAAAAPRYGIQFLTE